MNEDTTHQHFTNMRFRQMWWHLFDVLNERKSPATTQTPVKETSRSAPVNNAMYCTFAFIRPGVSCKFQNAYKLARTIGGLIPDAPSLSSQLSQRFSILLGLNFSSSSRRTGTNFLAFFSSWGVLYLIETAPGASRIHLVTSDQYTSPFYRD